MITEIINSFVNVRNKIKNNQNEWVDLTEKESTQKMTSSLNRQINEGEVYPVFSAFGKEVTLDMFEFRTDSSVFPVLYVQPNSVGQNYTNNIFHVISKTGRGNATPNFIDLHGSTYLDVTRSSNGDKVTLKRPITLPKGCYLGFKSLSGGNVTYKAMWTESEGHV